MNDDDKYAEKLVLGLNEEDELVICTRPKHVRFAHTLLKIVDPAYILVEDGYVMVRGARETAVYKIENTDAEVVYATLLLYWGREAGDEQ